MSNLVQKIPIFKKLKMGIKAVFIICLLLTHYSK